MAIDRECYLCYSSSMNTYRLTPAAYLAMFTFFLLAITVAAWFADAPLVYLAGIPATIAFGLATADVASSYARR